MVSLLRMWRPLGLRLHLNNGLAHPAVLLPLLQSLGLPEEVLEVVRARVASQKAPKKVSREEDSCRCFGPRLTCLIIRLRG